jgi:hypothetical protein
VVRWSSGCQQALLLAQQGPLHHCIHGFRCQSCMVEHTQLLGNSCMCCIVPNPKRFLDSLHSAVTFRVQLLQRLQAPAALLCLAPSSSR